MVIQTPWEKNGSPDYNYVTSPEDEAAFFAEVVATGRVALTRLGDSPSGRAINLVRIGADAPPDYAASPRSGLWVSGQHTRETSPREASLTLIRDLAETSDPDLLAYLAAHPMFFIPTPHPDTMGQEATPGVVDHNRDHFQLYHPGTRAIAHAINVIDPQLVQDMHTGGINDIDIEPSHFAGVYPGLRSLGSEAVASVRAHLVANGVSTGPLPVNEDLPVTLRNVAGLRHTLALLTEDYGGNVMSRRIEAEMHALRGVIAWHGANSERIAAVQGAARLAATGRGADASADFFIGSAHTEYAEGHKVLSPPPRSYRIEGSRRMDHLAPVLSALNVTVQPDGDRWVVDMAQPASSLAPFVLDRKSSEALTPALRVGPSFPPETFSAYGAVRVGGYECPIIRVGVMAEGVVRDVWQR